MAENGDYYKRTVTLNAGALRQSIAIGRRLQTELPIVAEDWLTPDSSLIKVVLKHRIQERYEVGRKVAEMAVWYAINGYDGHIRLLDEEPYLGLITDKAELEIIAREHMDKSTRDFGRRVVIASGYTPFSEEELQYAYQLSQEASNRMGSKANWKKIAEMFNSMPASGGIIRNSDSLERAVGRYKRKLEVARVA